MRINITVFLSLSVVDGFGIPMKAKWRKKNGKKKCYFYLCLRIVSLFGVLSSTSTANKQPPSSRSLCICTSFWFFFAAAWRKSRGKMNTHEKKRDTSQRRNFRCQEENVTHCFVQSNRQQQQNNWWQKENIKKRTICMCTSVYALLFFFYFTVINVLISRQQKIIGIAKFKGGLLMKITLSLSVMCRVQYHSVICRHFVRCTFVYFLARLFKQQHRHSGNIGLVRLGQRQRLSSCNPVSRNDNVDDASMML